MTEFKKGERVKVEFEGVVKDVGTYLLGLEVGGVYRSAKLSDATLLERPVEPLAVGSVVRHKIGTVWFVQRAGVHCVGRDGAFASGNTAEELARLVRNSPDLYTLIHDGSNK